MMDSYAAWIFSEGPVFALAQKIDLPDRQFFRNNAPIARTMMNRQKNWIQFPATVIPKTVQKENAHLLQFDLYPLFMCG
jgi:hypothetical protein